MSIDCPMRHQTQNFTMHYKAQLYSKNHEKIYTAAHGDHKEVLEQKHSKQKTNMYQSRVKNSP